MTQQAISVGGGNTSGELFAGRFRLERELQTGANSTVWSARDERSGGSVAVKVVGGPLAESALAGFARQAKATSAIASRHLVGVVDHGIADGTAYLAMELLEGEDLGRRLERDGRLSLSMTTSLVGQVAEALGRAQDARLVHGGMTAGHVFLAKVGSDDLVKLLGFGAGLTAAPSAAVDGAARREAAYLSPEQLRNQPVDTRSDLWSLGVVVFQALTGRPPFDAATLPDLVMKICADPLPTASRVAPGISPALDGFLKRALAREPAARFQSAQELATAFDVASAAGPSGPGAPIVAFVPVTVRARERSSGSAARTATWMSITLVLLIVVLFILFGLDKTRKRINDLFDDIGSVEAAPPYRA